MLTKLTPPLFSPSPSLCRLTWLTPLGPMRAELTLLGVRTLQFPEPEELCLPRPGDERKPVFLLIERLEGRHFITESCQELADALSDFLRGYFEDGRPQHVPRLDWTGHGPFDQAVWKVTSRIPYGQTLTYGELARAIGRPGAARAVGGALGRNPLPLLVPCHRVLAQAAGVRRWGGFSGGLDLKKWLIGHETHETANG